MKSLNRVTLLGNVTADPELKKTATTGKSVISFAIATNNEWLDNEGVLQKSADFHRIVAWERLAEICGKYLKKGSPVLLEGRLVNRSYEGKDNLRHYVTEVVASDIRLLEIHKAFAEEPAAS
ncbi:MAG: single-stranded DNA-binding protein [Candidatus Gracilibacteria bacterium]|jgi:single-strand DNA-binding protein